MRQNEVSKSKFFRLLAKEYPSQQSVFTEIINLKAILNLPKGTEHFISDIHGEFEAFNHIINNCSGVIREKIDIIFSERLSKSDRAELCTLIYYPKEKLKLMKEQQKAANDRYKSTLKILIELAKFLSSKYTRSKVRKALPDEFRYIIDELLHAQPDEDNNQSLYHEKILESILDTDSTNDFIYAICALIKRLAVDHLHIVGDIFDRGAHPDRIIDLLTECHSIDIQWGNHDILWMGAAAGSEACIAAAIRNNLTYNNMEFLESGYGISLRSLTLFANKTYSRSTPEKAAIQAITVILLKLEGQLIERNPDFFMQDRLLLDKIDIKNGTVNIGGETYKLINNDFPTIDSDMPYTLNADELAVTQELKAAFLNSERLKKHVRFLYSHGSIYKIFNANLLYHGCVPLDTDGNFCPVTLAGKTMQGKALFDFADYAAREGFLGDSEYLDIMYYLWCGKNSPLCGKPIKTFERTYLSDQKLWEEKKNPYYEYYNQKPVCDMILREFGLYNDHSHIINGHTPIKVSTGENPVKAGGKLIVIDGGFCKAYQKTTGIAGYTLVYNSHCLRLKQHKPFLSVEKILTENKDIDSESKIFETAGKRIMVNDSDIGATIRERIRDLEELLQIYRKGEITSIL